MILFPITVVDFGFESVVYSTSESGDTVNVAVIKYGSSTLSLSVRLSTVSGSATSPEDYTQLSDFDLTFSPEQRRQTVSISIVNDSILESAEQFSIMLTQLVPQARVMETLDSTTITITDDDCEGIDTNKVQYSDV